MGANHRYVLSEAAAATEINRLEQIDAYMGPTTERLIARLGIAPGWKCLEVGAGAGGVARWMATRVGVSGKVTAIDLAPRFAGDDDLPQLEVRRHDILAQEGGMERGFYDLAHCRLLLVNVGNAELALQRMAGALRPGGWLLVEEPGETRLPRVGESDPRVAEFNLLNEEFLQSLQARTTSIELNLFRRLPALLKDLGLINLGGELTHPMVGTEGRAVLVQTLQAIRPLLGEAPFVQEGRMGRLLELCADPTLLTMGGSTVSLWGQRPA